MLPPHFDTFSRARREGSDHGAQGRNNAVWGDREGGANTFSTSLCMVTFTDSQGGKEDGNHRREKHRHYPEARSATSGLRYLRQVKVGKYRKENLVWTVISKLMDIF